MRTRFGKSIDDYIQIFQKAFRTTWKHKYLWLFGFLAAGMNAGSVFQGALDAFWDIKPADQLGMHMVEKTAENLPWLFSYVEMLIQMDAWRASVMITILVLSLALFFLITIGSQYTLTLGLFHDAKRKNKRSIKQLITEIKHGPLWSLFATNILAVLAQSIIICLAAFPLMLLLGENQLSNLFSYGAIFLLLIPILFAISIIAMLTVVNIIRKNAHLLQALKHTLHVLKNNWIASLEIAGILFIINLLAGLGMALLIIFVIVPLGLLGTILLDLGITASVIIFSAIAAIMSLAISILYTAFMTTFNYSVWIHYSEKIDKRSLIPALESWFKAGVNILKK